MKKKKNEKNFNFISNFFCSKIFRTFFGIQFKNIIYFSTISSTKGRNNREMPLPGSRNFPPKNINPNIQNMPKIPSLEKNLFDLFSKYKKVVNTLDVAVDTVAIKKKPAKKEKFGRVAHVKDGIVTITGLSGIKAGEIVYILGTSNSTSKAKDRKVFSMRALILNLNENNSQGILLGSERFVFEGASVIRSGKLFKLFCSLGLFGQVLDGLGENKVKKNVKKFDSSSLVEQKASGIIDREPVRIPLCTGIKSIDSLVPIGRGQRELIIGDRQTGKTSVALDIILNHVSLNDQYRFFSKTSSVKNLRQIVWFVYNAIGQKQSTVNQVKATLAKYKATWFTSIIAATAAESAPLQFLAPYTACTLGEYIRDIVGGHCTVIFDDLSKHAVAYRQMSLLLRRPPGREAFPGDVFYVHSRLLERAGALTKTKKQVRGTLTAFPVIETQAGDVSAYIPTNVISITDGQIFLETELFYRGIRPAVNVGLSVSRVGSAAQPGIMKKIAGSLKMELAQFREIEGFSKLGASLDEQTQRLLNRGENLIEILKQNLHMPLSTLEEVFSIYLGVGYNGSWLVDMQKQLKNLKRKSGSLLLSKKRIQLSWLEWFRLLCVDFTIFQVSPLITKLLGFINRVGFVKLNRNITAEVSLLKQLKIFPGVFFDDVLFSFLAENSVLSSRDLQPMTFASTLNLYTLSMNKNIINTKCAYVHIKPYVYEEEFDNAEYMPVNNTNVFEHFMIYVKKAILTQAPVLKFFIRILLKVKKTKKTKKATNKSLSLIRLRISKINLKKDVQFLKNEEYLTIKKFEMLSVVYLRTLGLFGGTRVTKQISH